MRSGPWSCWQARHPGTAVIGRVSDAGGRVTVPSLGIAGESGQIQAV